MVKRTLIVLLVLIIAFPLIPVAVANGPVTPTPPSWIPGGQYLVFTSSAIYEPEAWEKLLSIRALCDEGKYDEAFTAARAVTLGNRDPGFVYEYALVYYKLFTEGKNVSSAIWNPMWNSANATTDKDLRGHMFKLAARARYWDHVPPTAVFHIQYLLSELVKHDGFNRTEFLAHEDFDAARNTTSFKRNYETLILIDGRYVESETAPYVVNSRTLIPIRAVAETIGATVGWNDATRTVTITRASRVISMVIDDEYATVNGQRVKMDAAPQITGGRTFLPVRFVTEQFSQSVVWDGVNSVISISEDMSFSYEDSNMKDWFLGCGAILAQHNRGDPYSIGMNPRTAANANSARRTLASSWGCNNRDDVIKTIGRMTDGGHADDFEFDARLVNSLTDAEFKLLMEMSSEMDRYMWQLVKDLSAKWGATGIKAWDWFRMTHLAGWGYLAGYLELKEAYELAEPVARRLRDTFKSWDEATENYMDGYAYWSRTDVNRENTVYKQRLQIYEDLKAAQETRGLLFNPAVWTQPVKGVK